MRRTVLLTLSLLLVTLTISAQAPPDLDARVIAKIRNEAMQRSQAIDHVWWLSEVYGPRATGTPGFAQASEWATNRFTEWGLKNVHQERFPFGQGWTIDRFSVHLVSPQTQTLIGAPRWNSPSTQGPVLAEVQRSGPAVSGCGRCRRVARARIE